MRTRHTMFSSMLLCATTWLALATPASGAFLRPRLDDRAFDDLVAEVVARIPAHAPEWTNYNDSDPGVSLLQLLDLLATPGINGLIDEFQDTPPWDTLPRNDETYWQELGYMTMEAGLVLIAPNHVVGSDWPSTYWPNSHQQVMQEQYDKFRAYALAPEPLSLPLWLACGLPWIVARRGFVQVR